MSSRLPASTILEVVVSMVVIILVFGLAMTIFTNVMRVSVSAKKISACAQLQEALLTIEKAGEASSRSFSNGDYSIVEESRPYGQNGLIIIKLTAYDVNKVMIASVQKIIPAHG